MVAIVFVLMVITHTCELFNQQKRRRSGTDSLHVIARRTRKEIIWSKMLHRHSNVNILLRKRMNGLFIISE